MPAAGPPLAPQQPAQPQQRAPVAGLPPANLPAAANLHAAVDMQQHAAAHRAGPAPPDQGLPAPPDQLTSDSDEGFQPTMASSEPEEEEEAELEQQQPDEEAQPEGLMQANAMVDRVLAQMGEDAVPVEHGWNMQGGFEEQDTHRRTARWFLEHLDRPLYHQCGFTLRQWLYWECEWKSQNPNATEAAWEQRMKKELAQWMQNANYDRNTTYWPTSVHLVEKILGVQHAWELEYHPCLQCHKHCWGPLDRVEWRLPLASDNESSAEKKKIKFTYTCPVCSAPRFKEVPVPGKDKPELEPQHVSNHAYCVCA